MHAHVSLLVVYLLIVRFVVRKYMTTIMQLHTKAHHKNFIDAVNRKEVSEKVEVPPLQRLRVSYPILLETQNMHTHVHTHTQFRTHTHTHTHTYTTLFIAHFYVIQINQLNVQMLTQLF